MEEKQYKRHKVDSKDLLANRAMGGDRVDSEGLLANRFISVVEGLGESIGKSKLGQPKIGTCVEVRSKTSLSKGFNSGGLVHWRPVGGPTSTRLNNPLAQENIVGRISCYWGLARLPVL